MNPLSALGQTNEVTLDDVLIQFLKAERHRWSTVPSELHHRIERCISHRGADIGIVVREYFERMGNKENPVYTRLLGPRSTKNESFHFTNIPVGRLISKGADLELKSSLDCVGGRITDFAQSKARDFPDIFPRLGNSPQGDLRTLITIVGKDNGISGVEVIDGFHRAVAMILLGEEVIPAFVVRSRE